MSTTAGDVLRRNARLLAAAAACLCVGTALGAVARSGTAPLTPRSAPGALYFAGRNLVVAALLWAGAATGGLLTVVLLVFNGVFLGAAVFGARDPAVALAYVLPHAVVELPAFVVAGAAGFRPPVAVAQYLRGHRATLVDRATLRDTGRLAALSAALVVVAAVVEAYVTPALASTVLTRLLAAAG